MNLNTYITASYTLHSRQSAASRPKSKTSFHSAASSLSKHKTPFRPAGSSHTKRKTPFRSRASSHTKRKTPFRSAASSHPHHGFFFRPGSRHPKQSSPAGKPPDYAVYQFTRRELFENLLMFALLDGVIATLFYRSIIAFLLLLPGVWPFLKSRSSQLCRSRNREILAQFTTGMQLVNASLQAGYAIENAFRESIGELLKIYPEDSFIIIEFRYILAQTGLNVPIEALLLDLGHRTHNEDIRNFAEVFQTAKRTGGDMIAIIRNAVTSIQIKRETQEEIEANLSGKASEQKVMSLAPIFLIGYTSITSPGFLDVCYHNVLGISIMTVCLLIYLVAFLWGQKIMQIEM